MRFDESQATELLINCIDRVSVNRVIQQLKSEPRMQLKYLDSLFHKESRSALTAAPFSAHVSYA